MAYAASAKSCFNSTAGPKKLSIARWSKAPIRRSPNDVGEEKHRHRPSDHRSSPVRLDPLRVRLETDGAGGASWTGLCIGRLKLQCAFWQAAAFRVKVQPELLDLDSNKHTPPQLDTATPTRCKDAVRYGPMEIVLMVA